MNDSVARLGILKNLNFTVQTSAIAIIIVTVITFAT